MEQATLRLFKAVQVDHNTESGKQLNTEERFINQGYVLDGAIKPTRQLLAAIDAVIGFSGEQANAAFHKSWKTIEAADMEVLVKQQVLHYLTTYGFQCDGIYDDHTIYIPNELLNVPALTKDLPITVVKAMTADEILAGIIKLSSGIALSAQSLADIMCIVKGNAYDSDFIKQIKNRELVALLNDHYGIVPDEPVAFLRYVVSKLTDQSLLIKNEALIKQLEQANGKFLDLLMKDAPANLASIFFRFKPLFLALKKASKNKTVFNQLRRDADAMHVPLPVDYLGQVTAMIKNQQLDFNELAAQLKTANVFKKIRLAYALKYRLNYKRSILYKVRNGRGWATDFNWSSALDQVTQGAYDRVIAAVIEDLKAQVNGQQFFIPGHVFYALPATEKQFTGHLPTGSYVAVPEDIVVGIHWQNTQKTVDLDLAVIGESGKIGWDAGYRSGDNQVLFSGDVTSAPAPLGATELFYMKQGPQEPRILTVNYYNFTQSDEVDCKILVAQEQPKNFVKNHVVDVNNMVASATIKIDKRQNVIGLVTQVDGENRVYFSNSSVGNAITSRANSHATHIRKYLVGVTQSSIDFRDMLIRSGATVVSEMNGDDCVDLSPEALDKTTFLKLLMGD